MIAIVDVCSGNLRSVERALAQVGAEVVVTTDPAVVERADKIVVPGQGTYGMFMRGLAERDLEAPLRAAIANGTPYFGICLGLQVLFEHSEEGDVAGLGVLAGKVVRLRPENPAHKIPHMGWNQVAMRRPVAGLADGAHAYFVHSYYVVPDDPAIVALETTHGVTFCSAIQHANLFACQFHPEKSQAVGLGLLRAFAGGRVKLYPAIDLLGGRAVRLEEGRRERATVFSERPLELVAALARGGADRLHVVDLDGAFAGAPQQLALVRELVAASPIPVEIGGGIRDRAAIDAAVELGAAFVVLGTAAVRSPALVEDACRAYPGRLIVAVDARDGIVAVDGWTQAGGITAIELGTRAASWGAAALLYTDVARDGLHVGPNVLATVALARAVDCEVIASGGVGSLDDLARLRDAGIAAVIVGRALYDRRFTVDEAAHVAHG